MWEHRLNTVAVQAGLNTDKHCRSVIPAIHLSSTYSLERLYEKPQYEYSRCGNPTRDVLGEAIASLEGGDIGIVTNTGTSALHLICQLLQPMDTVVVPHDLYGGSYRLFKHLADRSSFKLLVIDLNDHKEVENAISLSPKMLLIESPSNPLLRLVDIERLSLRFRKAGAIVVVDNTFMTPFLQQPLRLGADVVIHSTTKFINGHSDMVGGAVVAKDRELGEKLSWWANCIGVTGSAFDSYLALRGLKTLPIRLREQERSANAVVQFLAGHDQVSSIHYPGLKGHPGYQIACKQQGGFGSILSFEIEGGSTAVDAFLSHLNLFTLAQSLGGVESLICHPSSMTHAGMELAQQRKAGITPGLLRISVGLESTRDLVLDLENALRYSSLTLKAV